MLHRHTSWAAAALVALGLVLASSAPRHATAQPAGVAPPRTAVQPPAALAEVLRERVDRLRYDAGRDVRGSHIVLDDWVARYYEAQQFRPAWQDGSRLDELIVALGELRDDGLSPDDYHHDSLMSFRLDHRMGRLTPGERADLDLLATDAFMLALYHLYRGKVDPHTLSSQWNFGDRPIAVETGLQQLAERLAAGQVRETFEASRPQHVWYQRGRVRLREYRAMAARGGWPTLPDGPTLRPGMKDSRVPVLRRRLTVTHDLATPAAVAAAGDPFGGPADPELFDASLEAAVRHFQVRHGMNADGAVGPATRAALNVPVGARIDQIRVNLERARWTLHEIKGDFVLVDVAGFYVSYFRDDEPIWTSKVVVGRDERETPIFRSLITYVVFNPTWTIPPGILVKDKLPELKRNPGALKRMNIRVLDGSGREVDPYTIDWHRYGPGRLPPYQFRQDSGADNALGLVKIMFPNPYLVYLHDSPAKSLYDRDQRTFSSGCIRVQKAFELAELVLNDPQWDDVAIQRAVAGGETRTVTLQKPVPVLLLYWTAQPTPDGHVYFRGDVYDRDAPTLRALDGSFRAPGQAPGAP
jgi:L,D-transpeptidase YcbB